MKAGESPLNQGRSVCRPPLSARRRRSRDLRKNAAVERREARRSALWTGNPVSQTGWVSPQGRPTAAADSAAANFGAPLPSDGGAKGSKPTIWTEARRDAPRGSDPARLDKTDGEKTLLHFGKTNPRPDVTRDCFASLAMTWMVCRKPNRVIARSAQRDEAISATRVGLDGPNAAPDGPNTTRILAERTQELE